jgi:hypothetical protein
MTAKLKRAAKDVGAMFVYTSEPKSFIDPWFVMPVKGGKMYGDCDDYAITVLYRTLGFWGFVWRVLIKHDAKVMFGYTRSGEGHAIGVLDGLWFDNFSLKAIPKDKFLAETGHRVVSQYYAHKIIPKLMYGFFRRNK